MKFRVFIKNNDEYIRQVNIEARTPEKAAIKGLEKFKTDNPDETCAKLACVMFGE